MIYLGLSILSSTTILILFRWMKTRGANARQSIMLNYFVAAIVGFAFFEGSSFDSEAAWFFPASVLGILFYLVFRLIALTTQTNGVTVAGIVTKMSVLIPIATGIVFLSESLHYMKFIGIGLGLGAVYLSTRNNAEIKDWKWPLLAFIGSGLVDTSLNLFQIWLVPEQDFPSFVATIFLFAFMAGSAHHMTFKDRSIQPITYLSGTLLGLVNFGSIYFLLLALSLPSFESSVIFPINHVGVVLFSSISAIHLFKEPANKRVILSIVIALAAIVLLYWSH